MISPPFGWITCPVIKRASSEAKNKKAGAISFGIAALSIGLSLPNVAIFSGSKEDTIRGVQTGPGATAFTLIPFFTKLADKLLVNETIAPLLAA